MPIIRRDEKSLIIKFRGTVARPAKYGHTNPLAPTGSHLRELARVEVKLISGDTRRVSVDVIPDGKYIVAAGKFTEIWYLDEEVKLSPPKKKWQGKKGNNHGKTKRPPQNRNVGTNNRGRKKVGQKNPNRKHRGRGHLGRSKVRSN